MLIDTVEMRWPELGPLAREQAVRVEDLDMLQRLTLKITTAQTAEDARQALLNWQETAQK
ncbi:MAG TPA: hypothetical protein VKR06_35205 [Ktedonosporobacter sp.]|nr:hypothetical protein [Ktedonosporobacter sp.]